VCALGITEPGTGSDMAAIATRAERHGDHYLLRGSKIFTTNGVYGDLYFVAAAAMILHVNALPEGGPTQPPHRDAEKDP